MGLDDWKISRATSVYKGTGSLEDPSHKRPISVISYVIKVMEQVVQIQVTDYLQDHKLITSDQSVYLKKHSLKHRCIR